jgi:phosphoribosylanthranilate isomerase
VTGNESSAVKESGTTLIKFCGLTRAEDAGHAARLGAAYVGSIFTESPRRVDRHQATSIFSASGTELGHVAVFGSEPVGHILEIALAVGADVVQLQSPRATNEIETLRKNFPGDIWIVIPIEPDSAIVPAGAADLAELGDSLLFDARVHGRTGGTGVALSWEQLAQSVAPFRERTRIVLAGGLNPGNVAHAIRAFRPAVVDVSSGVEISPGIKDHHRMAAFAEAVRSASID